jgi:hypothetical protein
MNNKKLPYLLAILIFVFTSGCKSAAINSANQSDPTNTGNAGDTNGSNNSNQPTTGTSAGNQPSTNSTFKAKSYVVGIDRCGGASCESPQEKIPPKELWCATGYRACPKK